MLHAERIHPDTGEPCTLTEWIRLAAPWSYAQCFAAMRDCEDLRDMPQEALASVPQANFAVLRQLSTAVRNEPAVIQAAQTQRADQLIAHVQKHHADQHIEARKTLRFPMTEGEAADVEEAIVVAMEKGARSRTEAILMICLDYLASVAFDEIVKEIR